MALLRHCYFCSLLAASAACGMIHAVSNESRVSACKSAECVPSVCVCTECVLSICSVHLPSVYRVCEDGEDACDGTVG